MVSPPANEVGDQFKDVTASTRGSSRVAWRASSARSALGPRTEELNVSTTSPLFPLRKPPSSDPRI